MRALPMRALIVISIAIGVIYYAHSNTPTEIQMRDAFNHYLVDRRLRRYSSSRKPAVPVPSSGSKQSEMTGLKLSLFENLNASKRESKPGYDCTFNVDIDLANGVMQRALKGRFYNTSMGTAFELVERPVRTSFAGK